MVKISRKRTPKDETKTLTDGGQHYGLRQTQNKMWRG